MLDDDQHLLGEAIALAEASVAAGGGPFGAVVVRDGEIIARGSNQVTATCDPTAHAEIVAIREACRTLDTFQLTGCQLYASCEPCPMCLGAIYWARPERLVFAATREMAAAAGFDDALIYAEIPLAPADRQLTTDVIAHPDRERPFVSWQQRDDRREY